MIALGMNDTTESNDRTLSAPSPSIEAPELAPGAVLDRYVVLKRIGSGGMGTVYLAFDGELDRRVAIKVLRARATSRVTAGEMRQRLLREAQAMAKVSHPNVVAVFDVGTFGEEVFVAMEFVDGVTLREWRGQGAKGPRSTREIVEAYIKAGRGLEAAHTEGILHRDFKPTNVLVDERGRVKVLDFGLARFEATSDVAASDDTVDDRDDRKGLLASSITHFGAIMGTPAYMAPEQLVGEQATVRSDQFAFCVALYEALHGNAPFESGDTLDTRAENIHAARFRPVRKDARVPRGVRRVIVRGMSGAPEKRFASMGELLGELKRAMRAPRRRMLAGAIAAAALTVCAIVVARPAPVKLCRGASDVLAPAWNDARAEDVRRAFDASHNPRASEAFLHVRPVLDRYAGSWVGMYTDACEATRIRGEQSEEGLDLRMACLRQRQREMKATVDLLAHADEKTVDKSVEAAAALTPVDACADIASLRAPFAPPKSEEQRRAVDELRRKLAELQAAERAGREEAYAMATDLVSESTKADYPPLHAEALWWKGTMELDRESGSAPATLFEAAAAAEESRNDDIAAQAWIRLVLAADMEQIAAQDGARFARLAEAAIGRVGGSEALQANLYDAESRSAYVRGAQADAVTLARKALAIRERTPGPPRPEMLQTRSNLSDALWDEGEIEQSLAILGPLLRDRASLLGESHPLTIRTRCDVAEAHVEQGEYAAAIDELQAVRKLEGPNTPPNRVANRRAIEAEALVGAGRIDEAVVLNEQALPVYASGGDAEVGSQLSTFARFLVYREAFSDAEKYANRALDLLGKTDSRPQEKAEAGGVRALCEARRGEANAAIVDADAALDAKVKFLGARADLIPLLARGEARLALRRADDAVADLERALVLGDANRGDRGIRAEVRVALARALVASNGDRARAAALASRAATELDVADLPDAAGRVRVWLAGSRLGQR